MLLLVKTWSFIVYFITFSFDMDGEQSFKNKTPTHTRNEHTVLPFAQSMVSMDYMKWQLNK